LKTTLLEFIGDDSLEDMTMQIVGSQDRENQLLLEIDAAIERAGNMMNMSDFAGTSEDDYQDAYEARYHCGVCTVREVMEAIWPAVDTYINFLKDSHPKASAQDVAVAALQFFTDPNQTAFSNLSAALDIFAKEM
jgi:hypothetical protein